MKCKYSPEFDKLVIANNDDELIQLSIDAAQLAYKCKKAIDHYHAFLKDRDFYRADYVAGNIHFVVSYLRGVVQDLFGMGFEHDFGAQARRAARESARDILRFITSF